jgi:hypothetical protein
MASDIYEDPIINKVIEVLNANGPSKLESRYINGDVLLPNKSDLPICYIAKDQVLAQPADNMEDEHLQLLVATVILDITDDLNEAYTAVQGVPELYKMVEARDEQYRLLSDTLLYQLRNSQQIDDKMWIGVGSPVQVNYGMGVERRGPGIFSIEAVIRFTVRLHLPAPGYY